MGKTIYERVASEIVNITDIEGLPKDEYKKAFGIKK